MADTRVVFPLSRRLGAEFLGTLILVATVVGSGIMAERLADGNTAIALLGNTIPTGAILVVLITVLGPLSGAHFNPAVSLVFALRRELQAAELGVYALAQVLGGCAGTVVAHLMFGEAVFVFGEQLRNGGAQWFSEGVATFALVFTILGGLRFRADAVPLLVGLVITAGYWFTASTSFANPAVTIARSLTNSFSGIAPPDVPGFVLAQLAGALLALAVAAWLLAPHGAQPARAQASAQGRQAP